MGGGYITNLLNKDIKEISKIYLSLISIGIICLGIFLGINITKSSYALFSDKIISANTIEVEADTCNLYVPNEPILDNSMIPIYYDEDENVWKKADSTNQDRNYEWYDYCEKKWANSVTVSSSNRATYLNASPGTEIPMEDILTMQVWIPRYKYKVWNYNSDGTKISSPQEIEIVFEEGTNSTGEITCSDNIQGEDGDGTSEICKLKSTNIECTDSTCNNKYYTHPAFTFGSEEIEGFWVGKFEMSILETHVCFTFPSNDNCNRTDIAPLALPDKKTYRYARVSSFEANIMKMNDENNQYGFSVNTDTHMIKNMEWGAVAYLSHSKYGTCTNGECHEVGINNNSNYITGCGAVAGSESSTTCNSYNTENGMKASTTGNIYGIYDMSGGSSEYVMGNIVSPDGVTMLSGYEINANSGYRGVVYDSGKYTNYTGLLLYPDSKYYDKYSFGTNANQRQRSKLGDGIKEIYNYAEYGWYDDYSYIATNIYSWIHRGGRYGAESNAGVFISNNNYYGSSYEYVSSRFIIMP